MYGVLVSFRQEKSIRGNDFWLSLTRPEFAVPLVAASGTGLSENRVIDVLLYGYSTQRNRAISECGASLDRASQPDASIYPRIKEARASRRLEDAHHEKPPGAALEDGRGV